MMPGATVKPPEAEAATPGAPPAGAPPDDGLEEGALPEGSTSVASPRGGRAGSDSAAISAGDGRVDGGAQSTVIAHDDSVMHAASSRAAARNRDGKGIRASDKRSSLPRCWRTRISAAAPRPISRG